MTESSFLKNAGQLRGHKREKCRLLVRFVVRDAEKTGVVTNISASGVYIHTKQKVRAGETVIVAFFKENTIPFVTVVGQVARVSKGGFGVMFKRKELPWEKRFPWRPSNVFRTRRKRLPMDANV